MIKITLYQWSDNSITLSRKLDFSNFSTFLIEVKLVYRIDIPQEKENTSFSIDCYSSSILPINYLKNYIKIIEILLFPQFHPFHDHSFYYMNYNSNRL